MAYCGKCGEQVKDGVKFCPSCGQVLDANTTSASNAQNEYRPTYQQPVRTQTNEADAQANKTMAILAYIIFFIPLITGAHNTSPFVKYHTNQGTVLFIASLAYGVVYWIITSILASILLNSGSWGLWSVLTTIFGLTWLVVVALCIIGIVNAASGQMKPLPVIGKFTVIR